MRVERSCLIHLFGQERGFSEGLITSVPEVLSVVLFTHRLVILQLLKDHRASTGRRTFLGLRRSERTLTDLAAGQKAHEPGAPLFPHSHDLWESVQISND